jgi:hypothetical protein
MTNDLKGRGLHQGCEVQASAGQEPLEEAGPVLHPLEPVFTWAVSWARLRLARLARERLRCDQRGAARQHDPDKDESPSRQKPRLRGSARLMCLLTEFAPTLKCSPRRHLLSSYVIGLPTARLSPNPSST